MQHYFFHLKMSMNCLPSRGTWVNSRLFYLS